MAYPDIYDECFNGDHDACAQYGRDKVPEGYVGGGFCICRCHWGDSEHRNDPWIDEVWERVRQSKEREAAL